MAARSKWRSVLTIVSAVVLVLGLGLGFILWDASRRAHDIIRRAEEERARFFAAVRARSPERVSLFGGSAPGNAWDLYEKALPVIYSAVIPAGEGSQPTAPWRALSDSDFRSLSALLSRLVGQLVTALQTARVAVPFPYEDGENMRLSLRLEPLYAARFLGEIARRFHAGGRDREALISVFMALGMMRDLTRRGGADALFTLRMVEWESVQICEEILSTHRLSVAELEELCVMFDRLERSKPSVREEVEIRLMMEPRISWDEGLTRPGWRQLFNRDITRAAALGQYSDLRRQLDDVFRLPLHLRYNEALRRQWDDASAGRGHEALAWRHVTSGCYQEAFIEMQVTLLRTALAVARYEAEHSKFPATLEELVPKYLDKAPVCPFSAVPLRFSAGKLWSIGFDSKDDGGRPVSKTDEAYSSIHWMASQLPGDVVWTVGRK